MTAHVANPIPATLHTPRTPHVPAASEQPGKSRNNGQFQRGNRGGPGNPFNREIAAFRKRITQVVSVEQIDRVIEDLLAMAAERNLAAMKLLLQYTIGKPLPAVDPDRVDIDEWKLCAESNVDGDAARAVLMDGMPVRLATAYAGIMEDVKVEELKKEMVEGAAQRAEEAKLAAEEQAEIERGMEETRRAYREEKARRQAAGEPGEVEAQRPMTAEEIFALLSGNGPTNGLNGRPAAKVEAGWPLANGHIGDAGGSGTAAGVQGRRAERVPA